MRPTRIRDKEMNNINKINNLENEFWTLSGEVAVELCENKRNEIISKIRENLKERCKLQEENINNIDSMDVAQLIDLNAQLRNKRRKTESDKVNDEAQATQTGKNKYGPDNPYSIPNN